MRDPLILFINIIINALCRCSLTWLKIQFTTYKKIKAKCIYDTYAQNVYIYYTISKVKEQWGVGRCSQLLSFLVKQHQNVLRKDVTLTTASSKNVTSSVFGTLPKGPKLIQNLRLQNAYTKYIVERQLWTMPKRGSYSTCTCATHVRFIPSPTYMPHVALACMHSLTVCNGKELINWSWTYMHM